MTLSAKRCIDPVIFACGRVREREPAEAHQSFAVAGIRLAPINSIDRVVVA